MQNKELSEYLQIDWVRIDLHWNNKSQKSSVLTGFIYRHPLIDLNEFNDYYLHELLHKFSSGNKSVILPGDFNVNLVKYDNHHSTNFDYLSSYLFLSYITEPTRIRAPSKALIGNIFSNVLIKNTILGNITATTSDHLSPLIALPNIFSNPPSNKSNIYERG